MRRRSLCILPARTLAILPAFLAGALAFNVLEEALPAERESRIWPFALGAALYAAILIVV